MQTEVTKLDGKDNEQGTIYTVVPQNNEILKEWHLLSKVKSN
jgi:hypothetical protein